LPYEFKLLLRGSRDGFDVRSFEKKCYNKGATLVLIKLKEEDKIIGGYNPINWRGASKYLSTNHSFIFSFQSTLNPSTTILSRVKNAKNAIYDSMYGKHSFGNGDLRKVVFLMITRIELLKPIVSKSKITKYFKL